MVTAPQLELFSLPIVVEANNLERATSAKPPGLTISINLTWNEHISDVIKKASKRLYF